MLKHCLRFALAGALGFGIGAVIAIIIESAILSTVGYSIAGIIEGIILFAIGGASLGLMLKSKKKILYFSFASVVGIFICSFIVDIISRYLPMSYGIEGLIESVLLKTIAGAVLGASLGLVLKDIHKIMYLSFAGAFGFFVWGIMSVIRLNLISDSLKIGLMHFEFPVACIIIGFVFGLTLGYLTKKEEDKFISTTE